MRIDKKPETPLEAVTLGLYMSLVAPTEEQSHKASDIAFQIAAKARFSEHEIDTAKALAIAEMELFPTLSSRHNSP